MPQLFSTIACNLDTNILLASLPLFESEEVQAIEWSFDALFKVRNIPDWFVELLHAFSKEKRLIGHGVFFSLFSGKWSEQQEDWLKRLKRMSGTFNFDHITEHFGFMTGADFHKGAPISVPFTKTTLALGQDRLKRIYEACQCPVGLENLAFSYSLDEVKRHGDFLERLIEPMNGFIILDVHNLYCQLHNFDIAFQEIIHLHPLDRVREIHISGGSWEDSSILPGKKVRRDTHDSAVPDEVFSLLKKAIPHCPNLKYVVLEQLGTGLETAESRQQFRRDFHTMCQIVEAANMDAPEKALKSFLPAKHFELGEPLEDQTLHAQQLELSHILETAADYEEAKTRLAASSLAHSSWQVERWEPFMLETVMRIAQKWKKGF